MSDKIPCKECKALVLPSTAEKNEGLCMPCKKGTRKSLIAQQKQNKDEVKRNQKIYDLLNSHGLLSEGIPESGVLECDISDFLKKIVPDRVVELHSIESGIRDLDEHGLEYEHFFFDIAKASNGELIIENIQTICPHPSEDDEVEMLDVRIAVKSNKGRHKFKLKSYYELIVFYKILRWSKKVLGKNVMFLGNEDFSIYCLPKQIITEIESYGVTTVSPLKCMGNWYWINKLELILDTLSFKIEKLKKTFSMNS